MKTIRKKAMAWSYIVALIVALVIILVLFVLPKQVTEAGESAAIDIACQNSLAYSQAYKPITVKDRELFDRNKDIAHISCPTKYEKTSKTDDKELAFELASLISNCKKLYSRHWNLFDTSIRSVCIVCSSLEMPKDKINDFIPHLKDLNPIAAPGSDYLQYLFEVQDTSSIEASKSAYFDLDTEGRIAVVFVAGIERITQFMAMDNYGIGLVKYKNINTLNCHLLEGETELIVQQ